ncbi:17812_t:CDS:2 [Funneliformis caledonium]|uniref:17812_t:CDS:1 n=1 Tax=Funneliformis caledonium TaxID=1117310 RepID=A0A9N9ELJ7_9GLOM|nr:17812_t:CDS:2 [Funneliformis caledonium]
MSKIFPPNFLPPHTVEKSEKPSLKSFLDFRLQEGDLEREETEHSRYRGELNTILNYHAEAPEIREEVQQVLRNFQVNIFYLGYTVIDYPAGCVLAVEKVACLLWKRLRACWLVYSVGRLLCGLRAYRGKDEKKSKEVNSFWDLQVKQQIIHEP